MYLSNYCLHSGHDCFAALDKPGAGACSRAANRMKPVYERFMVLQELLLSNMGVARALNGNRYGCSADSGMKTDQPGKRDSIKRNLVISPTKVRIRVEESIKASD